VSGNYLTLDDVLGIHQDSIEAFGGSNGIRDSGGLEAAVTRPQSGYYPDVIVAKSSFYRWQ
jgi:death-on-curing protein